jgi:hypothetical protein
MRDVNGTLIAGALEGLFESSAGVGGALVQQSAGQPQPAPGLEDARALGGRRGGTLGGGRARTLDVPYASWRLRSSGPGSTPTSSTSTARACV